jgi:hypothetical protein
MVFNKQSGGSHSGGGDCGCGYGVIRSSARAMIFTVYMCVCVFL